MAGDLTAKQRAFADAVIAGESLVDAYRTAYSSTASDKTVAKEASRLRKHSGIDACIVAGMATQAAEHGITHESHAAKLIAIQNAATAKGDHATALRCQLELAEFLKVKAEGQGLDSVEERRLLDAALAILTDDELDAYIAIARKLDHEVDRLRKGGEPFKRPAAVYVPKYTNAP